MRPSAWWYLGTLGILGLALVVAAGLLVGGVQESRRIGQEVTSVAPGDTGLVTFDQTGAFTLYYAGPRVVDMPSEIPALVADVAADMRPVDGGAAVVLSPYDPESSVAIQQSGANQIVAMQTFRITEPGDYRLTVGRVDGVPTELARFLVAESPYAPLASGALGALVVVGVGALVSLIATIGLAVTRGRSKRQLPSGSWPGQGGGGAASPGWSTPPVPGWVGPAPVVPPPPPGYGPTDQRR